MRRFNLPQILGMRGQRDSFENSRELASNRVASRNSTHATTTAGTVAVSSKPIKMLGRSKDASADHFCAHSRGFCVAAVVLGPWRDHRESWRLVSAPERFYCSSK